MAPTWPTNTATPPPGWEVLTEFDGTRPMGWFTTTNQAEMRIVVRGYPTWDDAPFPLDADDRIPPTPEELDFDDAEIHLHKIFDLAYRGYAFPDTGTGGCAVTGTGTHSYTNLDFVGGWAEAIGRGPHAEAALLERTVTGAKPASDVVLSPGLDHRPWIPAARDAGLEVIAYSAYRFTRLWVTPPQLADRVDRDALTTAWHTLADADPDTARADRIRATVDTGLATAFTLDLTQPPHGEPETWWDESSDDGLVVLGAVLGYPPATTYALLCEPDDEAITCLPTRWHPSATTPHTRRWSTLCPPAHPPPRPPTATHPAGRSPVRKPTWRSSSTLRCAAVTPTPRRPPSPGAATTAATWWARGRGSGLP